jgi:hypothetical protein
MKISANKQTEKEYVLAIVLELIMFSFLLGRSITKLIEVSTIVAIAYISLVLLLQGFAFYTALGIYRSFTISETGITALWFGHFEKFYPWESISYRAIVDFEQRHGSYRKYFLFSTRRYGFPVKGYQRSGAFYHVFFPLSNLYFEYTSERYAAYKAVCKQELIFDLKKG